MACEGRLTFSSAIILRALSPRPASVPQARRMSSNRWASSTKPSTFREAVFIALVVAICALFSTPYEAHEQDAHESLNRGEAGGPLERIAPSAPASRDRSSDLSLLEPTLVHPPCGEEHG